MEAQLHGADLSFAQLHGANLKRAELHGADLRWAQLHDAAMVGTELGMSDLRGVDISTTADWAALRARLAKDISDEDIRDKVLETFADAEGREIFIAPLSIENAMIERESELAGQIGKLLDKQKFFEPPAEAEYYDVLVSYLADELACRDAYVARGFKSRAIDMAYGLPRYMVDLLMADVLRRDMAGVLRRDMADVLLAEKLAATLQNAECSAVIAKGLAMLSVRMRARFSEIAHEATLSDE